MNKRFTIKYYFIISIYLNIIFYSILCDCPPESPILKDDICTSIYCSEEQFKSGDCKINNTIIKTKWLNNIIKFENTKGDNYLTVNKDLSRIFFSTTLSNNRDRIIYALDKDQIYFFKNTSNHPISFISKKRLSYQNKEIVDGQLYSINKDDNNFLILIGKENSEIQILNLDSYEDDYYFITQSDFLNGTKIIKGISSYCKLVNNIFYTAIITSSEDGSQNYFLTFYSHKFSVENGKLKLSYNYKNEIDNIKGEYASCFLESNNNAYFSCFYLNKQDKYVISLITVNENDKYFQIKEPINIGNSSESIENKIYFLKGIEIGEKKSIYVYYTGDNNEIPTFIFKKIDDTTFDISEPFPIVYLTDYEFNNDIKNNDLIKFNSNSIFFISTSKNNDFLIITYFILSKNNISIRYFIIEFKKYYNIKILNGLKGIFFENPILTLSFNYFNCSDELCQNIEEENKNTALIFFSYIKKNNDNIDFIDYAITYNKDYILIDFEDNCIIENNIFGFEIIYIKKGHWIFDNGIKLFYVISGDNVLEDEFEEIFIEDSLIKISFDNYSFDKINIDIDYTYFLENPYNGIDFNEYADKLNNNYGNNDNTGYQNLNYISPVFHFYININYNLSLECNNSNCTLCLRNDTDYCLVCKEEYTIIYNKKFFYGKKKICENITITDEITYLSEEITNLEVSYTEKININIGTEKMTLNGDNSTEKLTLDVDIDNEKLISDSNIFIEKLTLDGFLNGQYENNYLSDEDIKLLYNDVKDYLINDYDGNDKIIYSKNVKVQISSIDSDTNSLELSDIDLGECGKILKEKYCNSKDDSLIILKFDIIPENEKSTYVQYEIYNPEAKIFLELKECSENNIIIKVPIDLDYNIEELYKLLAESGYNLFDPYNSFYNDICATYTTPNGTDILLYDRRMDIYQITINISLCQEGCKFENYDLETKKAKCNCPVQTNEIKTNSSELDFDRNEMLDEFYEILKNSNFKVLKCHKLPFTPKIFIRNIGSIIMTILLIIFLSLIIFYIVKSSSDIKNYIKSILKMKILEKHNNIPIINNKDKDTSKVEKTKEIKDIKLENFKNDIIEDNNNNKIHNNLINSIKDKKIIKKRKQKKSNTTINKTNKLNIKKVNGKFKIIGDKKFRINTEFKKAPPKRNNKKNENIQDSDNRSIISKNNDNKNKNLILNGYIPLIFNFNKLNNENKNEINKTNVKENKKKDDIFFTPHHIKSSLKEKIKINKSSIKKTKKSNKNVNFFERRIDKKHGTTNNNISLDLQNKKQQNEKLIELNDQEMNTLEYEKAIEIDKRTYFQFYCSLIKKKQLIIFTFLPTNDYNIMPLKISLFIVSFSLYFTIDAFFFGDESMHKIYKDNGVYNILFRIPQILYSSIIPSIINILLKTLSLTEKDLLEIKKEEDPQELLEKPNKIERCIMIKFIIFFIISLLFMLFFWYYISCFCAVYNNTQIILIKDTIISFAISMTYPFALSLLPGLLRIPALKAQHKDQKCLYKFSQYIALLI